MSQTEKEKSVRTLSIVPLSSKLAGSSCTMDSAIWRHCDRGAEYESVSVSSISMRLKTEENSSHPIELQRGPGS
jgi:hypothetical protein